MSDEEANKTELYQAFRANMEAMQKQKEAAFEAMSLEEQAEDVWNSLSTTRQEQQRQIEASGGSTIQEKLTLPKSEWKTWRGMPMFTPEEVAKLDRGEPLEEPMRFYPWKYRDKGFTVKQLEELRAKGYPDVE